MVYHIVPDLLGAIILAVTFVLCLRSFRREDQPRPQSSDRESGPEPARETVPAKPSLAEILNLVDDDVDRVHVRRGAAASVRSSFSRPVDPLEGIEVTVRVNAQHARDTTIPVRPPDIINAVWEPVDPAHLTFAGNFPTLYQNFSPGRGRMTGPGSTR